MSELYKKYRPTTFKAIVGQEGALRVLNSMGKANRIPHAILFTGPSGCGKTTLARILKEKLKCGDLDFFECNCSDFRGIDMVREIRSRINSSPLVAGGCRIWLIDEMHQMTSNAQDALLKLLEDTPSHVYFLLCTTDATKLKTAIKTRCTEIKVQLLTPAQQRQVIQRVLAAEEKEFDDEVIDKIIKLSEGSARKALVLLDSIVTLDDTEEQLNSLEANDSTAEGIEICRLLFAKSPSWADVASKLRAYKGDVEQLRWQVLGYAKSIMASGKDPSRCYEVIASFRDPFYDSKEAGLFAACWEVAGSRK